VVDVVNESRRKRADCGLRVAFLDDKSGGLRGGQLNGAMARTTGTRRKRGRARRPLSKRVWNIFLHVL